MHTQGKNIAIRYLSDNAALDGAVCEPNIEDAYMLYLKENGASLSSFANGEIGGVCS